MIDMPMFKSREEFYSALWDDYRSYIKTAKVKNSKNQDADISLESDISKCIYYRFIKRKKNSAAEEISFSRDMLKEYAEKPKRDKYILLHGAYLAFKRENIAEEEYKDIFTSIIDSSKKNSRKYLQLLEKDIKEANRQLEYFILRGCVSDFFDNEGFKASGESLNSASRHRKEKQGYNDIIEMLHFYMRKKNMSAEVSEKAAEISEDYIEKCSKLYNDAIREKQKEAFIPLFFDHDSGAGIFIVGRDRFKGKNSFKGKTDCTICIIYFSELHGDDEGYISSHEEITIVMYAVQYDTVSEAFREFSKEVSSHTYLENYAEMNFHNNRYFCPDGTDNIFIPRLIPVREAEKPRKAAEATKRELEIMKRIGAEEDRKIDILKAKSL